MPSANKSKPAKPLFINESLNTFLIHSTLVPLGRCFSYLERLFFGNAPPKFPPVFLLGLPRSGSTLIYQAIVHAYKFGYPTNLTNTIPFAPTLLTWLSCRLGKAYTSDFESVYGRSRGLMSPAEGDMWHLWFKNYEHQDLRDVSRFGKEEAVRFVGRIERLFGAPFINKHLKHDLRVRALADLFPSAVFVVIVRNPIDTAISLLRGRAEVTGSERKWLSVRPRNYAQLTDLPPDEQVCAQIDGILKDLRDDMVHVGTHRFVAIHYETFTRSPPESIEKLAQFLSERNVPLESTGSLPSTFETSQRRSIGVTPEQNASIVKNCTRLFGDNLAIELPCRTI